MLTPDRKQKIANMFNKKVVQNLKRRGVVLTSAEQQLYRDEAVAIYMEAGPGFIDYGEESKKEKNLPYSFLMVDDDPSILVSTPEYIQAKLSAGKDKHFRIAPKMVISLTTNLVYFMRIYRPNAHITNKDYPEAYSKKQAANLERFKMPHKYKVRETLCGAKYYVLEPYREGDNLLILMKRTSTTPAQMLSAFTQACQQVGRWHNENLLYLDLKPSNIRFDARTNKGIVIDYETPCPDLTQSKRLRGTPSYAHPRLLKAIKNEETITYVKSDDVYSVLETATELFTWMGAKEKNKACRELFYHYVSIFEDLQKDLSTNPPTPWSSEKLPNMDEVLATLGRAQRTYTYLLDALGLPPVRLDKPAKLTSFPPRQGPTISG